MRGATLPPTAQATRRSDFNPRSPCGERLNFSKSFHSSQTISTHAPHAGSDPSLPSTSHRQCDFNPRSPCGERPAPLTCPCPWLYFNPRSPCGERPCQRRRSGPCADISTHAPHAGSDKLATLYTIKNQIFQPTLPMRGATPGIIQRRAKNGNFNPRSPCGERLVSYSEIIDWDGFQPTLPMRGATSVYVSPEEIGSLFQPTLPMRGATKRADPHHQGSQDFNPRSPCGERPASMLVLATSLWISTHAPHAGSDCRYKQKRIFNFVYMRQITEPL